MNFNRTVDTPAGSSASRKGSGNSKPEAPDLWYRGQYSNGSDLGGRFLFLGVRGLLCATSYAVLAPPASSPWSLAARLPALAPSTVYPAVPPTPLITDTAARLFQLPPAPSLIFLGLVLSSHQFAWYVLAFRREVYPLHGPNAAIEQSCIVNTLDGLTILLFAYGRTHNPTWSPSFLGPAWVLPMLAGLALHFVADFGKFLFKRDPANKGKVLTSGVWSWCRHPNFLGILVWRTVFAAMAGGWIWGALVASLFSFLSFKAGPEGLEPHMAKKYGAQWTRVTTQVPYKLIPYVY